MHLSTRPATRRRRASPSGALSPCSSAKLYSVVVRLPGVEESPSELVPGKKKVVRRVPRESVIQVQVATRSSHTLLYFLLLGRLHRRRRCLLLVRGCWAFPVLPARLRRFDDSFRQTRAPRFAVKCIAPDDVLLSHSEQPGKVAFAIGVSPSAASERGRKRAVRCGNNETSFKHQSPANYKATLPVRNARRLTDATHSLIPASRLRNNGRVRNSTLDSDRFVQPCHRAANSSGVSTCSPCEGPPWPLSSSSYPASCLSSSKVSCASDAMLMWKICSSKSFIRVLWFGNEN